MRHPNQHGLRSLQGAQAPGSSRAKHEGSSPVCAPSCRRSVRDGNVLEHARATEMCCAMWKTATASGDVSHITVFSAGSWNLGRLLAAFVRRRMGCSRLVSSNSRVIYLLQAIILADDIVNSAGAICAKLYRFKGSSRLAAPRSLRENNGCQGHAQF